MKTKRTRYQQGSIRKVPRANGFAWEARFSTWTVDGKQQYKSDYFSGSEYPTEASVRKALQQKVILTNSKAGRAKVNARFGVVIALYRIKHLPELQHSTQQTNSYLLNSYIEPKFGSVRITEVTPLAVLDWFETLKVSATTKAAIRSVISVCLNMASIHGYISVSEVNPMSKVRIKGTSKRKKKITPVTMKQFRDLVTALPEPVNIMALLTGSLGLRVSEMVALKWEDIDPKIQKISIRRKFTHGALGLTKSDASEADLPMAESLLEVLAGWKQKTDNSPWVFPSAYTGGPRSASMLLQKGLKPVAAKLGLGRVTWHTLRHACRSWLDSGNTQVGVQKDLLRHADVSTTMNIYGHALSDDMRKSHNQMVAQLVPDSLLKK